MSEFDMDLDNEIGLGDEDKDKVQSNKFEWYKAEKGRTDLVSIVYFHTYEFNAVKKARVAARAAGKDLTTEQMKEVAAKTRSALATKLGKSVDELSDVDLLDTSEVAFKVHDVVFSKEHKIGALSRIGKDGIEADALWKKLGEPKTQVSTLLLKYPTNSEGEIDRDRLAKGWKLIPWKFGTDKYDMIKKVNKTLSKNGLSISGQDLKIDCSDTTFQKITLEGEGQAIWTKNEAFKQKVLAKAVEIINSGRLVPAKDMSTDELREKLGLAPVRAGNDVSTEDFSNILASV